MELERKREEHIAKTVPKPTSAVSATDVGEMAAEAVQGADEVDGVDNGGATGGERTAACPVCGLVRPMLWCSACHLKGYCSAECQSRGWKRHKKLCKAYTSRER